MLQAIRRRRWLKVVLGLVGSVLMAMLLTTAATQVLSYWAVHPPREQNTRTPASLGLPYEDVAFTTQDGLQLRGWFLPTIYSDATVILGHGFSRSRQELLDVAAMLHRNRYNVLMFDWRAHGESEGTRTTFGYKEVKDVSAAVAYITSRPELDSQRIGVLGKSMGGAIAIRAAAKLPQIKAVVSDSPYPSLQDSIQVGVDRRGPLGVWPFRFIALSLGLNAIGIDPGLVRPIDDIADISPRPVLIIHGGRDALVPADTGTRLYAAAGEPKYLWYAPDVAHVEMSSRYPREYEARVVQFFDHALKVPRVAACRPGLMDSLSLFRDNRALLPD
jgi:fermentation-respiration switch protein FrsA (DUF1100 family)